MFLSALLVLGIVLLAFAIRCAVKGTPFGSRCPCTPDIEHLRHLEHEEKPKSREQV